MKRTVEVSTPGCQLSRRREQLRIRKAGTEVGSIPLEDLGVLILDADQLTVTAGALEGLARHGGVAVVTGPDHLPVGMLLPQRAHTTLAERLRAQVGASRPLCKNLWRLVVQCKIRNQASLLPAGSSRERLRHMASAVRSGDTANVEAQAARIYWARLFHEAPPAVVPRPFRRARVGPCPNPFLNYGYAVLRAAMARALCGAGLLPALGIHHHGRYDPFCLADDLMEPFRPWVDAVALDLVEEGWTDITRETKVRLLKVLAADVDMGDGTGAVLLSMERAAASLARCFLDGAAGRSAPEAAAGLRLPVFNSTAVRSGC